MEHRQLERFLAVIEHGSLAAAARHLHLTQQALSASLANLEQDLGVRLFDRSPAASPSLPRTARPSSATPGPSSPAPSGRARSCWRSADGRTGVVTVGLGESFAGDIIAEAMLRFRKARPGVRVNLIEGYSEKLRHRLYDGEFDFIAAGVSAYELAEGFTREVIYSTNDVIAVRPEHPLAQRRGLTLEDLEGHAWLVPYSRPADLEVIVEAFVAENLEPPRAIVGSDAYRIGMQLLLASDLLHHGLARAHRARADPAAGGPQGARHRPAHGPAERQPDLPDRPAADAAGGAAPGGGARRGTLGVAVRDARAGGRRGRRRPARARETLNARHCAHDSSPSSRTRRSSASFSPSSW